MMPQARWRRSRVGAATAAWTPLDLPSLAAWWDPSDLSTLWKDTAGTDPVTADGDSVARMDDKSGNGYHLTQGTASLRPVYRSGGYLDYDGTRYLSRSASVIGLYAAGACSVFAAVNGAAQDDKRVFAEGHATNNNPVYSVIQSGSSGQGVSTSNLSVYIRRDSGGVLMSGNDGADYGLAFDSTWRVLGLIDSSGSITAVIDGSVSATDTYGRTGTITVNRMALGALLRGAASSQFTGYIGGVVATTAALSADDRTSLSDYLAI